MALIHVDISGGQVTQADTLSSAMQTVRNWQTDVSGANHVRPGIVSYATTGLGSSPFIALYRWQAWIVGVTEDRKMYALSDATPTHWIDISDAVETNTVDGGQAPVFAESISALYVVGGGPIQKWTGAGPSARLGAGPNATHICNVSQRLIANDLIHPDRIEYSDIGAGSDTSWGALSFESAEARPDPLRAVYEATAEMMLFGASTCEVFGISTDPLIPFQRVTVIDIGISAPYSPIRLDGAYAWLDDRRRFVLSADRRGYEVISDAITKQLRQLTRVDDCFGYREETDQYALLVWVFPSDGVTFAYDYGAKKWVERNTYNQATQLQGAWPVTSYAYWPAYNRHLVGTTTAGLYELDTATRTDLGGPILCERVTGWQDFGIAGRKRSSRTRLTMRRGTTPLAGTEGLLEVAVDDDGRGFGGFKTISMGLPGDSREYMDLFFGGVFHRRRYWLRYSGTDDTSLVYLHDEVNGLEGQAA